MFNRKFAIAVSVILTATVVILSCSKKDIPGEVPRPDTPRSLSQPSQYLIVSVLDSNRDLGVIINDPISHKQFAGFGHKNEYGEMDTLIFLVETDMQTGEWLAHEYSTSGLPASTRTSTGHTIEYTFNEPAKTGSAVVKETSSGKELYRISDEELLDDFWDNVRGMRDAQRVRQRHPFPPAWQAQIAYLTSAGVGCVMGLGGMALGGNPFMLGWGIYNTYQNCKSFADAATNMWSGNPVFGCMKLADNNNVASGFLETMIGNFNDIGNLATGLIPTLVGYVAQDAAAGKCDRKTGLPIAKSRLSGGWGDPHLFTTDGRVFDFHGHGEFIVTKSTVDNFEVQVRQENLHIIKAQATVNTALAVQTGKDIICVTAGPQRLYINNVLRSLDFSMIALQDGASVEKVIEKGYPELVITTSKQDEIRIRLDNGFNGSYIDYTIALNNERAGKVKGLLGNADGDPANDLQSANGQVIQPLFDQLYPGFANAWRVQQAQSLFYYESGKSTASYTKTDFPSAPVTIPADKLAWAENICKNAGVTQQPALNACAFDVAITDDEKMALNALWNMANTPPVNNAFDIGDLQLQGNASMQNGYLRLTEAKVFLSGQAFYPTAIKGNFETSFKFEMPFSSNGGADGFALLIAKSIPTLTPNSYPGSAGKLGYQGVPASLAVEFDTWTDGGENSNHIAIHTNGAQPNSTHYTSTVASNHTIPELQGIVHQAKIRYQKQQLRIWMDDVLILE